MPDPFAADGATLVASYEHVCRTIEVAGLPIAGWNEMTGGGTQRDGQNYVFGAGDTPRAITYGKVTPQDIALKLEEATWQILRATLKVIALSLGDTSETNHQKVPFQLVDQFRGALPGIPSKTTTYTVVINAEKPNTPNSGEQFYMDLTLKQTGVAQESFA